MINVSNAEFMLLQLLCEKGGVSGYEINAIVEERGYRHWADIGSTSVYNSLEKLLKKGFAECYVDTEKRGKGPLPKKFSITADGRGALLENIGSALSSTRERDKRFDLGLAACNFLDRAEVKKALAGRKQLLVEAKENIKKKYAQQHISATPAHVRYLFNHPAYLIDTELRFIDNFLSDFSKEEAR